MGGVYKRCVCAASLLLAMVLQQAGFSSCLLDCLLVVSFTAGLPACRMDSVELEAVVVALDVVPGVLFCPRTSVLIQWDNWMQEVCG